MENAWQDSKPMTERTKHLLENPWLIPTDVTFRVGPTDHTEDISAHRLILAIGSEVFHSMLYAADRCAKLEIIRVSDVDPTAFHSMIKYLYTEDIGELIMTSVLDNLYCAKKYMVTNLAIQCRNYIFENLTWETVCIVFAQTALWDEERLHKFATAVICQHIVDVFATEDYLDMDAEFDPGVASKRPLIGNRESNLPRSSSVNQNPDFRSSQTTIVIYSRCVMITRHQSHDARKIDDFSGLTDCFRWPLLTANEIADGPAIDGVFNQDLDDQTLLCFVTPRQPRPARFYGVIQLMQTLHFGFHADHDDDESDDDSVDSSQYREETHVGAFIDRLHLEVFADVALITSALFLDIPSEDIPVRYGKIQFRQYGVTYSDTISGLLPKENDILPFEPFWVSLEMVQNLKDNKSTYQFHVAHHSDTSLTKGTVFAKVVNGVNLLERMDGVDAAYVDWDRDVDDVFSGLSRERPDGTSDLKELCTIGYVKKEEVISLEEYEEFIGTAMARSRTSRS